jgi:hypothetical protein
MDELWEAFMRSLDDAPLASRLVEFNPETALRFEPAVYIQCSGERVMYIGRSLDAYGRRQSHLQSGRSWDREWWIYAPDGLGGYDVDWLCAVEAGLIEYFQPALNREIHDSPMAQDVLCHAKATGLQLPI